MPASANPADLDTDWVYRAHAYAVAAATQVAVQHVRSGAAPASPSPVHIPIVQLIRPDRVTLLAAAQLTRLPDLKILVAAPAAALPLCRTLAPYSVPVTPHNWHVRPHDVLIVGAGFTRDEHGAPEPLVDTPIAARTAAAVVVRASPCPLFATARAERLLRARLIHVVPHSVFPPTEAFFAGVARLQQRLLRELHPIQLYAFVASLARTDTRLHLNAKLPPNTPTINIGGGDSTLHYDSTRLRAHVARFVAGSNNDGNDGNVSVDFAIIGGGVAGTACAYHLSALAPQATITLFEQGPSIPYAGSSSDCESRFYRRMSPDPFYAELMSRTMPLWRELEASAGRSLLFRNGVAFLGERRRPVSGLFGDEDEHRGGNAVSGNPDAAADVIDSSRRTMDQLGLPYEMLDGPAALSARFPGLSASDDDFGIFTPDGGQIDAAATCTAQARLAEERGVRVYCNVTLLELACVAPAAGASDGAGGQPSPARFVLYLSDGRVVHVRRRVVLAAGAWTTRVLRENFGLRLEADVRMVAWGHFELPDDAPDLPQWLFFRRRAHTGLTYGAHQTAAYYGFPATVAERAARTRRVIKAGMDFSPDIAGAEQADQVAETLGAAAGRAVHPAVRRDLVGFMRAHWPRVGAVTELRTSAYHMTKGHDFVLGQLPKQNGVVLFCGGNGRAFKFGPMIGACLADLAVGRAARCDISRFDPGRVISAADQEQTRRSAKL